MYALVDCNNFYVSCERMFNPGLEGKPVIVLSNNDGCAISRSDEAKALGIEMGAVPHLISEKVDISQLKIFSSNYTLYGDMSDRVMKLLSEFVPRMEIYSIDEAFLDMSNMPFVNLEALAVKIKTTIKQCCGIPVCVGIGPTKALAKVANRFAKKTNKAYGVYCAADKASIDFMLKQTPIGDIWNIGHQYELLLRRNGIFTGSDFVHVSEDFVRNNMTVHGLRLQMELKGTPCFEWEFEQEARKVICVSRSFGALTSDKALMAEALSNFAAACALKLRRQQSAARELRIFINTNPHRPQDKQCFKSIVLQLDTASNSTPELIKYALKALDIIFKDGCRYMKCGIEARNLVAENNIQFNIFIAGVTAKKKKLLSVLDKVNDGMGKELVRYGKQGFTRTYKARAAKLSPCYTTRFEHIIKAND